MKLNTEELGPTKKKLEVEIPPAQVQKVVESLYNDLKKTAKIKGFRKGKIPRRILEMYYSDYVKEKATYQLIDETYPKALEKTSIDAVSPPEIDSGTLEPGKSFNYTAVIEVLPEIDAVDYKNFKVPEMEAEVSAEEIDKEIDRLREIYSQLKPIEERDTVAQGDVVLIDFQGFLEDKPIQNGNAENYSLEIGSGSMLPELEEALVGKKIGVEHEINLTLPEEHPRKDIAGKEVVFKATVKELREKVIPALDDEFAKDIGECDSLQDLKEKVKENMQNAKEQSVKNQIRDSLVSQLIDANPIEVPSFLVDRRAQEMLQNLKYRLAAEQKVPTQKEEQEIKEQYMTFAERDVKSTFLLDNIAAQEKIEVTDEELNARIEEMATLYKRPIEELKQNTSLIDTVRQSMLHDKVLDLIGNEATTETPDQQETTEVITP